MCFLKELRPLANVSIFSVCHVHGHASLFLDRLGFQYKLNGDDRSVPNFCVYVICILKRKSFATLTKMLFPYF